MGYMGHDLILAPHIDDEIIGCYKYIINAVDTCIDICYFYDITKERRLSGDKLRNKVLHIDQTLYNGYDFKLDSNFIKYIVNKYDRILCPDPIFESHPDHKEIGNVGQYIYKNFQDENQIIFYSVNMTAPYIKKLNVDDQNDKRLWLNELYPDQASLWENDYKYFLFEGTCRWFLGSAD